MVTQTIQSKHTPGQLIFAAIGSKFPAVLNSFCTPPNKSAQNFEHQIQILICCHRMWHLFWSPDNVSALMFKIRPFCWSIIVKLFQTHYAITVNRFEVREHHFVTRVTAWVNAINHEIGTKYLLCIKRFGAFFLVAAKAAIHLLPSGMLRCFGFSERTNTSNDNNIQELIICCLACVSLFVMKTIHLSTAFLRYRWAVPFRLFGRWTW